MSLLRLLPLLAAALAMGAAPAAGQGRKLTWKNAAGKEITASFEGLSDGEVKLRLPGGQIHRTALTDLSWESACQAITQKWTPGGFADLRLDVPARAGASPAFLKLTKVPPAEAAPAGWTRSRCAHFDFDSQTVLDGKTVTQLAQVFESTRALLEALPWRIEAVPERGTRFRALIYKDLPTYHANGGPPGSLGVFKGHTGEISLPLSGAENGADTLKHEITHQMMQRLLPVIPWWVAEGTAEYVAIMKYENGGFDCQAVTKKQVLPHLQARAPYCTEAAFLKALEYRAQTQAEMVLDRMLEAGAGGRRMIQDRLAADVARVQNRLTSLEEQKATYLKMFSLAAGQSLVLPAAQPEKLLEKPQTSQREERRLGRPPRVAGGSEDMLELYATSAMMVYYLTTLAPDKGERFARYMWGVQQLRDEYDLSLQFFDRSFSDYRAKITALQGEVAALNRDLEQKTAHYAVWLAAAQKYAHANGRYEDAGQGRTRYTYAPGKEQTPPDPPGPLDIKIPEVPAPPVPLLTAAEVKTRREALLATLMDGSPAPDFVARVRDAAFKLGLRPGERAR